MEENPREKAKEIEEIKRRIENLVATDQISDSEKVAILKRALAIVEDHSTKGEV